MPDGGIGGEDGADWPRVDDRTADASRVWFGQERLGAGRTPHGRRLDAASRAGRVRGQGHGRRERRGRPVRR
jgi:hypothetical protein